MKNQKMPSGYSLLPNSLLSLELTANELAVYAYLLSIRHEVKNTATYWARAKQATIARKCGFKTPQTVGRISTLLLKKGLISQISRSVRSDRLNSVNIYSLNLPEMSGGYFLLDRAIFDEGLTAAQLRLYLYFLKTNSAALGCSWNSYGDISKQLRLKRSAVVQLIAELVEKKMIRKQQRKSAANRRVYVDNHYFIIIRVPHSPILRSSRRSVGKNRKGLLLSKDAAQTNRTNRSLKPLCCNHNSTKLLKGQEGTTIFLLSRGSPQNQISMLLPKNTYLKENTLLKKNK